MSVDTTKPEVARRAIDEGAVVINDVSGLRAGTEIAEIAARSKAGLILMHMQGEPRTMQADPRYEDLLGEIRASLAASSRAAEEAGVTGTGSWSIPGSDLGRRSSTISISCGTPRTSAGSARAS